MLSVMLKCSPEFVKFWERFLDFVVRLFGKGLSISDIGDVVRVLSECIR